MAEGAKLPGLPDDGRLFNLNQFKGLNTKSPRMAIDDQEMAWCENFFPIAPGNLRTMWDIGSSIYTAPNGKTVVYFFFYNIASTQYCAVFLSDGTAFQINVATHASTTISSAANTFYTGTTLPVAQQYGNQYILIANTNTTNDYWVWDGVALYGSGGLAPNVTITYSGSGYSSAPTIYFYGGSGSGAAGTATVTSGSVTSIQITNAGTGYSPGDIVEVHFTGGGSDISAQLTPVLTATTIAHLTVLAGGRGYVSPTVSITGGGGTGATATCTQVGGVITSITLTSPGSGFTSVPTATITGSPGTGAMIQVILTGTTVASVSVADAGSNYTSVPTLTFQGGGATTQATATATLTSGGISSVAVNTPGSGYTSVPNIFVQSGINNAAAATAALMPFGNSGNSIEIFLNRVFLTNKAKVQITDPGSITAFNTTLTSTDSFLKNQFTGLKQTNGFIYLFADSSVNDVSNLQTSGSPAITTLNNSNADPQVGTPWRDSIVTFGRDIVFANTNGIYVMYGGAAEKISDPLDGLFATATLPITGNVYPSAAFATVFGIKIYMILITCIDPFTGQPSPKLLCWDSKKWFIASQAVNFTFIGSQEVSSQLTAWGTNGNKIYPMFISPSSTLTKKGQTKQWNGDSYIIDKQILGLYLQAFDNTSSGFTLAFTVDTDVATSAVITINSQRDIVFVNDSGGVLQFVNSLNSSINFAVEGASIAGTDASNYGKVAGASFTSTSDDFTIVDISLLYKNQRFMR